MKHLVFISICTLLLFACKKDHNSTTNPADDYYVMCKADGQQIKYEGLYSSQLFSGVRSFERSYLGYSAKELYVDGSGDTKNAMHFAIFSTDSIKAGQNYMLTSASGFGAAVLTINNKSYRTYSSQIASSYTITVHINKHSDGWVSGTFSGKLAYQKTWDSDYEGMNVTEGSFQSKVNYYQY